MTRSEQIRELAQNKDHLLLFYCLMHGVDDQGRMEARVSTIQTVCLGHLPENAIKPRTIQEALLRMSTLRDKDDVPLIYIYEANGTKVLQFAKWWAHQGYMRNAWPSRWDPMPGWVDEFRGHGKVAFDRALRESRGNDGGTETSADGSPLYTSSSSSSSSKSPNGVTPWDLFAAYLEVRGIEAKDFPGPRIQLSHAKRMLGDGFSVEDVRAATEALSQDAFWINKGFDLATIAAHWGRLKNRGKAKAKPKAPAKIAPPPTDDPLPTW